MCLSPYSIPNPNFHSKNELIVATKDTTSYRINVPCGHCAQCIAARQLEMVQRILMESLNNHLFFTTLTYNEDYLPILVTSTGREIPFSDFHDIDLLIKRMRNDQVFPRGFRYVAVSERGGRKFRPHFHILWITPKEKTDDFNYCISLERMIFPAILARWSRNLGTRGHADYKCLTTYQKRFYAGKLHTNYDTHYVNPSLSTNGVSDAAFYVLKYMLKASPYERYLYASLKDELAPDEFYYTIKRVRSHCTMSKGVGNPTSPDVVNYINYCIQRSDVSLGYPQFFNPNTGQRFPLCQYYRTKFLNVYDGLNFGYNWFDKDGLSSEQKILRWKEFDKILQKVNEHESQVFYDVI